jgi:hypothetical protein
MVIIWTVYATEDAGSVPRRPCCGVGSASVTGVLTGCGGSPPAHVGVPSAVRPRAGEATYQLIQEPDEGYGQVIGVIAQVGNQSG